MFHSQFIQKNVIRAFCLIVLATLTIFSCAVSSASEAYPTRQINVIIPFLPGGVAGPTMQIFCDTAVKYLPRSQFLIEYKQGAATALAADYVLKQPRDGYTLMMMFYDLATKLAQDGDQLTFKMNDFSAIGVIGTAPQLLTVNKKSPLKTFEDFIKYAKEHPGELTYATGGIGSNMHLSGEVFMSECKVKLNPIPYPGSTHGMVALVGGHVDCLIAAPAALGDQVKPEGELRVLACLAPSRFPGLPDVPTCLEKGYNVNRNPIYALAAAKGIPQDVYDILCKTYQKTMNDPKMEEGLRKINIVAVNWGPEKTMKLMQEEYGLAKKYFKN